MPNELTYALVVVLWAMALYILNSACLQVWREVRSETQRRDLMKVTTDLASRGPGPGPGLAAKTPARPQELAAVLPPEVPPMPDLVRDWIDQESEPWAREQLEGEVQDLYEEYGDWSTAHRLMRERYEALREYDNLEAERQAMANLAWSGSGVESSTKEDWPTPEADVEEG